MKASSVIFICCLLTSLVAFSQEDEIGIAGNADKSYECLIHKKLKDAVFHLIFQDSDTTNRIEIYWKGEIEPFQVIEYPIYHEYADSFGCIDMNFDEYNDIRVVNSLAAYGNIDYAVWLFNPTETIFEWNQALHELQNPEPDSKNKVIRSHGVVSAAESVSTVWKFVNNELLVPQTGRDEESFVPSGYSIIAKEEADLNGDGLTDIVMVIAPTRNENEESPFSEDIRPLIVLFKQDDRTYRLSALTQNVVLCSACGGVRGDPFTGLEIKKNTFYLLHEGGTNVRWDTRRQFRLDHNEWYLIGETSSTYYAAPPGTPDNIDEPPFKLKDGEYCSYVLTDHNLLTGDVETSWGIQDNNEEVEGAGPYYSWQKTIRKKSGRDLVRLVDLEY